MAIMLASRVANTKIKLLDEYVCVCVCVCVCNGMISLNRFSFTIKLVIGPWKVYNYLIFM